MGAFGSAQQVSQDFPECIKDGHSVRDILGKNILQFGFVLAELMKNCYDSEEFVEVGGTLTTVPFLHGLVIFRLLFYMCVRFIIGSIFIFLCFMPSLIIIHPRAQKNKKKMKIKNDK